MTEYEAPKITEIGTITDLTEQNFNKNAGSSGHRHHRWHHHSDPRQRIHAVDLRLRD